MGWMGEREGKGCRRRDCTAEPSMEALVRADTTAVEGKEEVVVVVFDVKVA